MTSLVQADVIVLANHPLAQRKRARRFWGSMGVLLRFEDRRAPRADNRIRTNGTLAARKTAFATRAPRGD